MGGSNGTVKQKSTPLATHVIIGGMVFPWEAKAPYVASGYSILGGIEYIEALDLIRCHLCGEWFKRLPSHLREDEGVTVEQYKKSHGLAYSTVLKGAKLTAAIRSKPRRKPQYLAFIKQGQAAHRGPEVERKIYEIAERLGNTPNNTELKLAGLTEYTIKTALKVRSISEAMHKLGLKPRVWGRPTDSTRIPDIKDVAARGNAELRNLRSLCQAQIRTRLLKLVDELGRTPTFIQLRQAGLHGNTVPYALGFASMREVWESLGVKPNQRGFGPGFGSSYNRHHMHKPDVTTAL